MVVGEGARIGDRSWIDSHVVIGAGVTVGMDARIYPAVTLYSGTTLGDRVLVHAGARLGSDGFGYVFRNGIHDKIPHIGRCIVENDVEIGANSTIDRGSFDDTVVGAGTKIDNLVHIAHNVRVGRLCLIMAQVGIAGSTRWVTVSCWRGRLAFRGTSRSGTEPDLLRKPACSATYPRTRPGRLPGAAARNRSVRARRCCASSTSSGSSSGWSTENERCASDNLA